MLNFRWILRERIDEEAVQHIINTLGIPAAIARVLVGRGIATTEAVQQFFEPSLDALNSPWLMADMQVAVDRVERAIADGEQIWIHGDYDVDGTSSTAMMLHFLREVGARVQYFIPDRTVGFGFTRTSVDKAIAAGTKVIITVDIGITAIDAIAYAKEFGIDVIVCDHHETAEELPPAHAILDPIRPGCEYPFKSLAGCGVAFKLVQGVCDRLGRHELAHQYMDFVAIASAADIVPLVGENRILSHVGLEQLNSNPRPGLKGLIDCAGLTLGSINNSSIVFGLAPRINAAGRLGDPARAVEMMIQADELMSFRIAQELEQDNRRRRAIDEETFEEAATHAERLIQLSHPHSLVLHGDSWHAGVIGIVASRLVERFHLPTIMLTTIDGVAKGSARSIKDFDIHAALRTCEDLLIEYGGHKHAAGLSLEVDRVPELAARFDVIARQQLTTEMLTPEIDIDAELSLNELTPNFFKLLARFAPYGYGNHRPVFFSRGVVSANGVKIVGNNHLKFRAIQKNFAIDAIGFNLGHKISLCTNGKPFSVVYTLEENLFNGLTTPQLRIKDVRPDDAIE
ncbi:MAG: single-stranded-DNA-specific exonuclease RecJ [Candidatus Kapabacteria bacterium]|nr:single-stranded-DNA-specific exonuclease RecJ [Candidatus Kapabacteria bacterium]